MRDTLSGLTKRFAEGEPRGEFVIVVGAAPDVAAVSTDARELARRLLADGLKPSKAARELASIAGIGGDEAYAIVRGIGKEE